MDNSNIQDFIFDIVNQLVEEKFNKQFDRLAEEIKNKVINRTDLFLNTVKKGKDGYTPIKGKDYFDGDKGEIPSKSSLLSLIRPLIPKLPKVKKGDKGDKGEKGEKGEKGDKGDDGSPDKPEDIVKDLNTLENVLDVKVLKGLKPILRSIQDSLRTIKGGGMGNIEHQEFALTSSTSTATLTYNVAGNGYAIWVYYNGQAVSRNDSAGYSISGKTITLGFTPGDGTYLDIIYIRSG